MTLPLEFMESWNEHLTLPLKSMESWITHMTLPLKSMDCWITHMTLPLKSMEGCNAHIACRQTELQVCWDPKLITCGIEILHLMKDPIHISG